MRGQLSLKSKIYPESMYVYVAGISGKVSAQYPGRSALCLHSSYPRRMERTEDVVRHLTAVQKSAEGKVSPAISGDEGLNIKQGISPGFRWSKRCR